MLNYVTPRSAYHVTSPIFQQTGNENTQTYQVEVNSLNLTPNSIDLFTRKCVAAIEGRISNQILGVK